jgi:hypothetical protein
MGEAMTPRVEINREIGGVMIDIKLAESRWFGAFSVVFAAFAAWLAVAACGHGGAPIWGDAWVSAPLFLFSMVLNLRIYRCAQRIFVSDDYVDLFTMVGAIQVGEVRMPLRAIERVELKEHWVYLKGRRYLDRRIVFMSQDGELGRTTCLSIDDADLLLAGPLKLQS